MAFLPPPSLEIPRPPIEPPLHGLVDTAYVPDLSDLPGNQRDRWEAGISYYPNPVSCDHVTPWMSWTDAPEDKAEPGTNVPYSTYHSFTLTYSTHCLVTPGSLDANVDAAMDALKAGTSQAVEAVFWGPGSDGPLADLFPPTGANFSLSGSTPLITGYAAGSCNGILNQNATAGNIIAVSPRQALLALTQALGTCSLGARGFLHASPYIAEEWAEKGMITPSDPKDPTSKLITHIRGDYIVGGSGYAGTGPVDHPRETPAAGHAWAYATGPVGVLLSEPRSVETTLVDQRTNLHRIIVERTVAIAANTTCLFAIYVDVA